MPTTIIAVGVMVTSIFSGAMQVWLFLTPSVKHTRLYMYVVMLHIIYLVTEVLVYLLFAFGVVRTDAQFLDNKLEATSRPWAQYDSIIGYRAVSGTFRNVKYSNQELVYDHISKVNSQGWFSNNDYATERTKGVKRYAVLGDSFTAGFNIPTPWTDMVSADLDSVELYNFALEGIGINNWSLIYFKEILRYEFDGLIIAVSNEQFGIPDMDRKLMIMHTEADATLVGQYTNLPKPNAFYAQVSDMTKGYALLPEERIDQLVCGFEPKCAEDHAAPAVNLYFLSTVITVFKQLGAYFKLEREYEAYKKALQSRFPDNKEMVTWGDFKQKYPFATQLEGIIEHGKRHDKELLLVTIPDVSGAHNADLAKRTASEIELAASHFGIPHYNGFKCLDGLKDTLVASYYYKHDLHWNPKGAGLFSSCFSDWLYNLNH